VLYLKPLGSGPIINPERIGHADGKRSGPAERGDNFSKLRIKGDVHINHPLGHIIRIQAPVKTRIL
jgi:hypothetical protein